LNFVNEVVVNIICLAQSPCPFKQMLMVAEFDKY